MRLNTAVLTMALSTLLYSALTVSATSSAATDQVRESVAQVIQQNLDIVNPSLASGPENELHLARLVFNTNHQHGWGPGRPWWRIDWPEAEMHFIDGLQRYTVIDAAADSVHIELSNEALFDHPMLFAQQVGRWKVDNQQANNLGEYLKRGGFLLADDLHGPNDWATFKEVMQRALPENPIIDIKADDAVMAILYQLDQRTQIPGKRHIRFNDGQGNVDIQMPHSPARWRGIEDSTGRLMVAINFNMDMGDSWEHANDPDYPLPMTTLGYQLGINYVIYALSH